MLSLNGAILRRDHQSRHDHKRRLIAIFSDGGIRAREVSKFLPEGQQEEQEEVEMLLMNECEYIDFYVL